MRRRVACAITLLSAALPIASADAQVKARFRRVGLFEGSMPMVRSGSTSFVEVDLSWNGTQPFEGELRVNQQDRDGDIVTSAQGLGGLTPDGAWKPIQVYFYPSAVGSDSTLQVRLYNGSGELTKMLLDTGEEVSEIVTPPFYPQPAPDDLLVIDLTSPKKLPHVLCLDASTVVSDTINARHVRPLSPREIPQRWQGLEAVDAIVWDDADPSELSQQQIDALLNWVRNGGSLLISAGKNWQSLAASPLAEHLPASIKGVSQVREAQEFTREIVKYDAYAVKLSRQYAKNPISRCDLVKAPDAIGIPSDARGLSPIAYRLQMGRGNLTLLGASLRELLPTPPRVMKALNPEETQGTELSEEFVEFRRVCDSVVALNFLALPKSRESTAQFGFARTNLHDNVAATISYKGLGFAFMMFALFFAVAYFSSTLGAYAYMKKRGWQQHNWSAFALVSLAGTIIGIVMVWSLRGISTKVRQTTVIDARAGSDYGYATCFFGVKTPDHTRLDLRLPAGYPGDSGPRKLGPLRTLPRSSSSDVIESAFVATDTYRAVNYGEELQDVPVRATLKEFWGRWHGPLAGSIDAKLVIPTGGNGDRIGKGSYIHNHTGVALEDCFIIEGRQEIVGEGGNILARCLKLGSLAKTGPEASLDADAIAERVYFDPDPTAPNGPLKQIPGDQLNLTNVLTRWRKNAGAALAGTDAGDAVVGREFDSLRVLSLFDLVVSDDSGRNEVSRSYGRILDCSHAVTRETALLIGFSYEPPPILLEVNGTQRTPESSITMYRFVIPVERPRSAAGGDDEKDDDA